MMVSLTSSIRVLQARGGRCTCACDLLLWIVTPVSVFDTEDSNGVPDLFVRYRPFSMTASSVPDLHMDVRDLPSLRNPLWIFKAKTQHLKPLNPEPRTQKPYSKVGFPFICQSRNVEKDCDSQFVDNYNAQETRQQLLLVRV